MDNKKNNENNENGSKKSSRRLPSRMNLTLHIVIGVYLLYLAYSIFNSPSEEKGIALIIFPVFFCIVGAAVIVSSLRSLQRGEYEGGAADPEKDSAENGAEENGEEKHEENEDGEAESSVSIETTEKQKSKYE